MLEPHKLIITNNFPLSLECDKCHSDFPTTNDCPEFLKRTYTDLTKQDTVPGGVTRSIYSYLNHHTSSQFVLWDEFFTKLNSRESGTGPKTIFPVPFIRVTSEKLVRTTLLMQDLTYNIRGGGGRPHSKYSFLWEMKTIGETW